MEELEEIEDIVELGKYLRLPIGLNFEDQLILIIFNIRKLNFNIIGKNYLFYY
jgi:hypothetical protein